MEQELTVEELIALVNSQKGDFVIRVEFGEEAVFWCQRRTTSSLMWYP